MGCVDIVAIVSHEPLSLSLQLYYLLCNINIVPLAMAIALLL